MAFIEGTPIFTDSGFKNIEDIGGRDKVLVRNFLGDAEFIQPFALKKSQYDGEILTIGARNWQFSTTPEHKVAYDRSADVSGRDFRYEPAKNLKIDKNNRIYRQFKYVPPEEFKRETIVIHSEFGRRWVTISEHDWYVLVGFVLCRGYFDKAGPRKKALTLYLDKDKREDEVVLLADILDRIGVEWSLIPSFTNDKWMIRVKTNNTLSDRLITRLGSSKRKDMYLPDKMVYRGSKTLSKALIDTMQSLTRKPDTEGPYRFTTNNDKLIKSLVLLCTIWGFGAMVRVVAAKGTDVGRGELRKDVLQLEVTEVTATYSPKFIKKQNYSGKVYEIDLFDGQVYVKEGKMPVWVNPK